MSLVLGWDGPGERSPLEDAHRAMASNQHIGRQGDGSDQLLQAQAEAAEARTPLATPLPRSSSVAGAQSGVKSRAVRSQPERDQSLRGPIAAVVVLVTCILFAAVIPGAIAYRRHVFFVEDMTKKMPPHGAGELAAFEAEKAGLKKLLAKTDEALAKMPAGQSSDFAKLVETRGAIVSELKLAKAPFVPQAFVVNSLNQFYWPMFFTGFAWLVTIFRPRTRGRFSLRAAARILATGLATYLTYISPSWTRNFLAGEHARTIYTFVNWDVDHVSYLYQEVEHVALFLLIATAWWQWSRFLDERRQELLPFKKGAARKRVLDPELTARLSDTFAHWQVASSVLAATVFAILLFFWDNIGPRGDTRYLLSAFTLHAVSLITFGVVSLPLIVTWQCWSAARAAALAELSTAAQVATNEGVARAELQLKLLVEARPVSMFGAATSGIVVAGSLIIPVLQSLLR